MSTLLWFIKMDKFKHRQTYIPFKVAKLFYIYFTCLKVYLRQLYTATNAKGVYSIPSSVSTCLSYDAVEIFLVKGVPLTGVRTHVWQLTNIIFIVCPNILSHTHYLYRSTTHTARGDNSTVACSSFPTIHLIRAYQTAKCKIRRSLIYV